MFVTHHYGGKQVGESEEHERHDEVDQVADGEGDQKDVELPLELLAAEHYDC